MRILLYLPIFFFAMFKFMFTPLAGKLASLSYFETFFSTATGALTAAFVFYFSSEYFLKRARRKRREKYFKALEAGAEIKKKKIFTRFNKIIVKLKMKVGIYFICWLVPLFLSIPLGSIICAKFYGHKKITIYLICTGILLNCFIITTIVYLFSDLFN